MIRKNSQLIIDGENPLYFNTASYAVNNSKSHLGKLQEPYQSGGSRAPRAAWPLQFDSGASLTPSLEMRLRYSDRGAPLSLNHTVGGSSTGGMAALLNRTTLEGLAANGDGRDCRAVGRRQRRRQ